MTMPHLMNCPHRGNSHCLGCVKAEWERQEREKDELARRLEAAESLSNVYRTEIDACRNERRAFFSRTMNYEEWQAASRQAEIAMAATDAAREVRGG